MASKPVEPKPVDATVMHNGASLPIATWIDPSQYQVDSGMQMLGGRFVTTSLLMPGETISIEGPAGMHRVTVPTAIVKWSTETMPGSKMYLVQWHASGEFRMEPSHERAN